MKKIIITLLTLLCCTMTYAQEVTTYEADDFLASMENNDKAALLMVHFGTTYDDTRAKTIDRINEKARKTFPQLEVRESFTSRIIIRRLKARGIMKDNPVEAMMKLCAEGYTHLIIQSTNLLEGAEMESLRRDVERMQPFFKEIRVGNPLLYDIADAQKVVGILKDRLPADAKKKEHVLLVGHGTETPATAIYSEIDYMFKANGHDNYHVTTLEGYPTYETALRKIQQMKGRTVILVPFLFVAGDHAQNDISQDWKKQLEAAGMKVVLHIEGLGEIPEIQDIYIDHIRRMLKYRTRSITEKKSIYTKQKD
ncbi:MAG: sirohydrochlorin cobaltochelatase [Prevotella sp.]|nr:sirohydrochlorin cobaltochelatase [Prevotella sp.]